MFDMIEHIVPHAPIINKQQSSGINLGFYILLGIANSGSNNLLVY